MGDTKIGNNFVENASRFSLSTIETNPKLNKSVETQSNRTNGHSYTTKPLSESDKVLHLANEILGEGEIGDVHPFHSLAQEQTSKTDKKISASLNKSFELNFNHQQQKVIDALIGMPSQFQTSKKESANNKESKLGKAGEKVYTQIKSGGQAVKNSFIGKSVGRVIHASKACFTKLRNDLSPLASTFKNKTLEKFGEVKTAIADSVVGEKLEEAKTLIGEKLEGAKTALEDAKGFISEKLTQAKDKVADSVVGEKLEEAKTLIGEKLEGAKTALEDAKGFINEKLTKAKDKVADSVVGEKLEEAKTLIGEKLEGAKTALEDAKDFISEKLTQAKDKIADSVVAKKLEEAKALIGEKLEGAKTTLEDAKDFISEKLKEAKDGVTNNGLGEKLGEAKTLIDEKLEKAKTTLKDAKEVIIKKWGDTQQAIDDGVIGKKLDNMKASISDKLSGAKEAIGAKLENTKAAIQKKWEALSSSKAKTEVIAEDIILSPQKIVRESTTKPSLETYSHLLDSIRDKGDGFKLSRTKGEGHEIFVKKATGTMDTIAVDKKSKTAFKEMLQAATNELEKDPLASLDLLNKMQSTHWGNQVLKYSPNLKARFQNAYKEGLEQCTQQARANFSFLLSNVEKKEFVLNGSYAGKPNYEEKCPNLYALTKTISDATSSIVDKILSKANFKERTVTMEMYIKLAHNAEEQGDMLTAQLIAAAFANSTISRLDNNINHFSPKVKEKFEKNYNTYSEVSEFKTAELKNKIFNYEGNERELPIIPILDKTILAPLTGIDQKISNMKALEYKYNLSNSCINEGLQIINKLVDKNITLEDKNVNEALVKELDTQIYKLNKDILDLEEKIQSNHKKGIPVPLSLSSEKEHVENELKEILMIQKIGQYTALIKSKIEEKSTENLEKDLVDQHIADLNMQKNEFIKGLEDPTVNEQKKLDLKVKIQNITFEKDKVASDLYSKLNSVLKENPNFDIKDILMKFQSDSEVNLKDSQKIIKAFEEKVNVLVSEFGDLIKSLSDSSPLAGEKKLWYSYTPPTFTKQEAKDIDDFYLKRSFLREPSKRKAV